MLVDMEMVLGMEIALQNKTKYMLPNLAEQTKEICYIVNDINK